VPDAIFCTNGPTALGALGSLRECGLNTPEDIGFVTFDELTVDDLFQPAITTIVQPAYEIGEQAAGILFDRIENKNSDAPGRRTIRLPASLKIRESSRPVSAKPARALG
jgi:LacI family transcriptional regulator